MHAFAAHGLDAQVRRTSADFDSARLLAIEASRTFDLVIAAGGDGTVHGVLQGIAGTTATLGILPFGTANALARNLGLPTDPVLAVRNLLSFQPKAIPLGCAETDEGKRWFTVMAGAGPDGTLIQELRPQIKARFGRRGYYMEAARLFLTRRFRPFHVEYRLLGSATWQAQSAVGIMAARVPDLGGLFKGLTAASRLHHPHLLVHLITSPAHLALPAWILLGKIGIAHANPWLITLEVEEVRCMPIDSKREIYAQVDGELAGPLPMKLSIVPAALRLLMPEASEGESPQSER